jgi:uroporphyrin-III C-methyltransferase
MKGRVIFVGAATGSADLLTLRAVRFLERADVVLYDDLVASEALEFVAPAAIVRSVGKRCGRRGMSQESVNALMIEYARQGRNVVRLKSGDPAIFGRLGEEIEALREAGVAFDIVPGVTAALAAAAAAQITLTDRRVASRVVFVAAHLAAGKRQDWADIASANTTMVIYMPGPDLAQLGVELQAAGVTASLPCAIVSHAGAADETITTGTVAGLADFKTVAAPAVVIVGEVVAENKTVSDAETTGVVSTM